MSETELRCPSNNSLALEKIDNEYFCLASRCTCPRKGRSFPYYKGKPFLIDDEISIFGNSINTPSPGDSQIRRPSSIEKLISEFIFGSNTGMKMRGGSICKLLPDKNSRILIIGSGEESIITSMLRNRYDHVVGIDVYSSSTVDYIADAHNMPFGNDSFDLVIIQSVLEHVLEPSRVVGEIYRVLSRDGIVYAETPFMQQVHEGAYDFLRFSKSAHRWLFRSFQELDSGVTKGPFTALLWSTRYALSSLLGNKKLAALGCLPIFWIRYLDKVSHAKFSRDGACEFFFMGRKSIRQLSHADIISYYK